jgi:hypothetical protein
MRPARNLVANLVYGETGANVQMTMVAGQIIYEQGEFTNLDRSAIMADVRAAVGRFEDAASADPAIGELPIVALTASGMI